MALVDRTADFSRAASAQVAAGVRPLANLPTGKRTPTEEARVFSKRAGEISKKIQLTFKRLHHLAEKTRGQGVFGDRAADEFNQMAANLRNDTKLLKMELDQLQNYLTSKRQQVGHGSANASAHSQNVVETMKLQLQHAVENFKNVLGERQETMQKKADRRKTFGAMRGSLSKRHPSAGTQQPDSLPRPAGVAATATQEHLYAGAPPGANSSGGAAQEPALLIQADQSTQYYADRAAAMSSIETHIVELNGIFNQLATMVVEQGAMVQRIDDNVRDTQDNVASGLAELQKSWENVRGNKRLALMITAVLLLFTTFFVTFLA